MRSQANGQPQANGQHPNGQPPVNANAQHPNGQPPGAKPQQPKPKQQPPKPAKTEKREGGDK
jgi:hypothetical protein